MNAESWYWTNESVIARHMLVCLIVVSLVFVEGACSCAYGPCHVRDSCSMFCGKSRCLELGCFISHPLNVLSSAVVDLRDVHDPIIELSAIYRIRRYIAR
jgi:hypothetical protein